MLSICSTGCLNAQAPSLSHGKVKATWSFQRGPQIKIVECRFGIKKSNQSRQLWMQTRMELVLAPYSNEQGRNCPFSHTPLQSHASLSDMFTPKPAPYICPEKQSGMPLLISPPPHLGFAEICGSYRWHFLYMPPNMEILEFRLVSLNKCIGLACMGKSTASC